MSPEDRLRELRRRGYNYDPERLDAHQWRIDDFRQPLPGEPPGPPVAGGSFETARRLMLGYEFHHPRLAGALRAALDG